MFQCGNPSQEFQTKNIAPQSVNYPMNAISSFEFVRLLDGDLRAHIKGNDPSFEMNKLAFFAEATGAVQESHILEAQNAVCNARKASLQAAFNLFKTSLGNDQVLHERHLAAAKTDEARNRSAALNSLEAGCGSRTFGKLLDTMI